MAGVRQTKRTDRRQLENQSWIIANPNAAWHFCDYADLISATDGAADHATLVAQVNQAFGLMNSDI